MNFKCIASRLVLVALPNCATTGPAQEPQQPTTFDCSSLCAKQATTVEGNRQCLDQCLVPLPLPWEEEIPRDPPEVTTQARAAIRRFDDVSEASEDSIISDVEVDDVLSEAENSRIKALKKITLLSA